MGEVVDLRPSDSGSEARIEYAETLRNIGSMLVRRTATRARRGDLVISFATSQESDALLALVESIRKRRPQ